MDLSRRLTALDCLNLDSESSRAHLPAMWPGDLLHLLFALGALAALVAARYWLKVVASIDTSGQVARGPDPRALGTAATFTAIALALPAVAYLYGRLRGLV